MPIKNPTFFKAFTSQPQEASLENLIIDGIIPQWLSGSFISVGAAQFEVGTTHFTHWFDGFSSLKKFHFHDGKVQFQNRFLQSNQYVDSNADGHLKMNEFATYADQSFLGRSLDALKNLIKPDKYDNCNVNTSRIDRHLIAMTETSQLIEFDLNNLKTIGKFNFTDQISGQFNSAHPHFDFARGDAINVTIEVDKLNKYHVYKILPHTTERQLIKTYVSDKLFYMHSFSITPTYIILFKSPLVLDKLKLMLGLPFNKALYWDKDVSSSFVIINRHDGSIQEIETEAFLCLHSVNAYEKGSDLILDLVCYKDQANPYDYFYFDYLKAENLPPPFTNLRRYIIDLQTKKSRFIPMDNTYIEFPRINYKAHNGQPYQFVYVGAITEGKKKFFDALQKINVETGKSQIFSKENYYFGEPVFIPNPTSKSEDDGVVVSIIYNAATELSSLVILDAITFQQQAEILLPFYLPFGLHGNFYS